uniref:PH domain-containing protein n=1 Tax=Musca domestica TaxID=7370 RepID=A0A1I8NGH5_MUSDO
MLVNSTTTASTPTPGSSSSTSNTLEPAHTISTNSSSSQLHQHLQQQQQHQHQRDSHASSSSVSASSSAQSYTQVHQQQHLSANLNSRPPSRAPSILDSPTLARVERARLRLEASAQQQQQSGNLNGSCGSNINTLNREDSLERSILDPKQSLLAGRIPVASMTGPIKRGLLWQQRDRLFSRWKERYFVLTRDYLHCFKRASGSANERASDMGQFIFKVSRLLYFSTHSIDLRGHTREDIDIRKF